jgi:hypothetical protein
MSRSSAPRLLPPLVRNVMVAERLLARLSRGRAFAWDDTSQSGRDEGVATRYPRVSSARRFEYSNAVKMFTSAGQAAEACTMLRIAHATSLPLTPDAAVECIVAAAASGGLAASASDAALFAGFDDSMEFTSANVARLGAAYLNAGDASGTVLAAFNLALAGDMPRAQELMSLTLDRALKMKFRESAFRDILTTLVKSRRGRNSQATDLLFNAALKLSLRSVDARDSNSAAQLWAALVSVADVSAAQCLRKVGTTRLSVAGPSLGATPTAVEREGADFDSDVAMAAVSLPFHHSAYEAVLRTGAARGDANTVAVVMSHLSRALLNPQEQIGALRSVFFPRSEGCVPPTPAVIYLAARTLAARENWQGALDAVKLYAFLRDGSLETRKYALFMGQDAVERRAQRVLEIAASLPPFEDVKNEGGSEECSLVDIAWPGANQLSALNVSSLLAECRSAIVDRSSHAGDVMSKSSLPLLSDAELEVLARAGSDDAIVDVAIRALSKLGRHDQVRALWGAGVGARFMEALVARKLSPPVEETHDVAFPFISNDGSARNVDAKEVEQLLSAPSLQAATWPAACIPAVIDAFAADSNELASLDVVNQLLDAGVPGRIHGSVLASVARWISESTAAAGRPLPSFAALVERLITEAPTASPAHVSGEIAKAVVLLHAPEMQATLTVAALTECAGSSGLDAFDLSQSFAAETDVPLSTAMLSHFEAMRARGLCVPPEAMLRVASATLGISITDADMMQSERRKSAIAQWAASKPMRSLLETYGRALAVFNGLRSRGYLELPAGATLSTEGVNSYLTLIDAGLAIAETIARSISARNDAVLSPLEAGIRESAANVYLVASALGHDGATSDESSIAHLALHGALAPLLRRPTPTDADAAASVSAQRLLRAAADIICAAPRARWARSDLESFYRASATVVAIVVPSRRGSAAARARFEASGGSASAAASAASTARALKSLLDAQEGPAALSVSPDALWSLAGTLRYSDAPPWMLARVLAGVGGEASAHQSQAVTATPIAVDDDTAAAAALAASRFSLVDAARRAWYDPPAFSGLVADFLRTAATEPVALSGRPNVAWTHMFLGVGAGPSQLSTLATLSIPPPSVAADGSVLRLLPSCAPPPASAVRAQRPAAADAAPASGARLSSFGDRMAALVDARGAALSVAACTLPPAAIAAALARAGRGDCAAVPHLAREFFRLGAWLSPSAAREVARAALRDRALLPPLLLHLQAQALALLRVVPDTAPFLPRFSRALPVTGSGVDAETLSMLVDAATAGGLLVVALQLLETAPASWRLPPAPLARLAALAEATGEAALAAQLVRSFGSAPAAGARSRLFANTITRARVADEAHSREAAAASRAFIAGSRLAALTSSVVGQLR